MDRNLFTDTNVTRDFFVGGAQETSYGVGLHQPFPVFRGENDEGDLWDIIAFPPYGLWTTYRPFDYWSHNNYLYQHLNRTNTPNVSGIYRRSIVGDPPQYMQNEGFTTLVDMFGESGSINSYRSYYDPDEEAVYINRLKNGNLSGVLGKWLMTSWPFTQANAEWIALDSTWPTFEAGKIYYQALRIFVANNMVFVSSYVGGHILVLNASTGATIGEFTYSTAFTFSGHFQLFGMDYTNSRIIGGAYVPPSTNFDGNIYSWDISDLNNWTPVDIILPANTYSYSYHIEVYGKSLNLLSGASPYYMVFFHHFGPHATQILGLPNSRILFRGQMSYQAPGAGIFEIDANGGVYKRYMANDPLRLSSMTGQSISFSPLNIVSINNVAYLAQTGVGTADMVIANDPYQPICPYLQIIGDGSYISQFTATSQEKPKRLLLTIDDDGWNREFSLHPGKHAFRIRLNGGAWSDYRAGNELLFLSNSINGKAPWPQWDTGYLVEIQHKINPGLFKHFLPPTYSEDPDKTYFEIPGLLDAGAPKEVQPILVTDPVELGGGIL